MPRLPSILGVCFLAITLCLPAFAGSNPDPDDDKIISCGNGVPGGINCVPTKKDLQEAHKAYARGLKLEEHQRYEEAFQQFDEAARLVPRDVQFFSAREVTKSQLVFQHAQRGEALLASAQRDPAVAEFRTAMKLDPDNDYMQKRLQEALRDPASPAPAIPASTGLPLLADSTEIHLQPKNDQATFNYRGDVRGLFNQLASSFGVTTQFDDSVQSKQVRFFVDNVDFFTALTLACRVSKTMWTALDAHQLLIAADTAENHKQFDRMSLATFSVPGASTPQEATEMVTSLRNICDFQKISSGASGTVEVRAPQATLAACTQLLHQLTSDRPQVSLDVEIYQIDHNFTREIGIHTPDTFNLYNIPVAALAGLGGQSIQSLVNQLISSGGINQAGSTALSGILAQLQSQASSIFSQPLATFGGGLTFSGLSLDHITAALTMNESWARSLSRATLRAGQGNEATFHLGERYPILNGTYAPIYNSSAISAVLGNQSYVAPFPSVSYEDLGLSLKAKPTIHGDGEVSMSLELQVRSLAGQSSNGVPVLSNQEYKGSIRLRDGEPAVVAGEITTNDQRSMSGIPWIAALPGLNQAVTDNNRMKEDDELLIVITPHVVASRNLTTDEIWVGAN
jgi:Flp pilus assembly secretin CpaC